jgi:glycerol-3-phosphate dehydrogenase
MSVSASPIFDIAIIGGGINGCGIARDAAGRGRSVALFEQGDLASATSQWSTKLIHGGLRYLERYEFRLVREALHEREVMMRIAPHLVTPLRFVLPHHKGLRPAWLLRIGLFLYDHIGGRKTLPPTRRIDLATDPAGAPLKPGYRTAFEYADASVDDARLVIANAMAASRLGAQIHTRRKVTAAKREGKTWIIESTGTDGSLATTLARALVNAAGPWVATVIEDVIHGDEAARIRLVKGSHIVVKKLFDHQKAYIFQNGDGRIIFAIPYREDFTLIGTTDEDYADRPEDVAISDDEITYLCASASEYFADAINPADVVWSYSGVRPLYDDGATVAQEATRDYVLRCSLHDGQTALLSIFGGKITTYRRLAEAALEALEPHLPPLPDIPEKAGWTGREPLPGGDFAVGGSDRLIAALASSHPWLACGQARRLVATYGSEAASILAGADKPSDLGRDFGGGLSEAELRHLVTQEWAMTAQDVLWRRTKLGLVLTDSEAAALAHWMDMNARQA